MAARSSKGPILYSKYLTIKSPTCKRKFIWDKAKLDKTAAGIAGLKIKQANMVLGWHIGNRSDGSVCPVGMDEVDYDVFSVAHKAVRFRSQRLIKTMFPPSTAALIYFTGRSVIVGAQTCILAVLGIYNACHVLYRFRKRRDMQFTVSGVSWVNGVYHGQFHSEIDLSKLADRRDDEHSITYDAEHFVGASIECMKLQNNTPGTIVLYTTGRFVCVGVKSPEVVEMGFANFLAFLEDCKKTHLPIGTHMAARATAKRKVCTT